MSTATARPPVWRDVRVLRFAFQAAVLAAVGLFAWWLAGNVRANARSTGIPLGFDYLDQRASFSIPGSSFRPSQPVSDALRVGFGNTLRIALAGIVGATVLGTLLGIARLSTNWLLSTLARVYVEIIRNVPLLILIVFSYLAVFLRLPRVEDATRIEGLFVLSVRGVTVPWARAGDDGLAVLALLVVAGAVGYGATRWRRRVAERTGQRAYAVTCGLLVFLVVAAVGHVALGSPVDVTAPNHVERRVTGGITMAPEYAALLAALIVYTASHIAEIVRGSIQAVPRGQSEAATALALSPAQRMRRVVLPQAMRVAVPALANQYLNLTKNSSLAVAISYFELTKVTQISIANRGAPVPSYGLLLAIYLVISLSIAAVTNLVNRRLALVER